MQVDPIKPVLKAPGSILLKLRNDGPLSDFAFHFNLRCFSEGKLATCAENFAFAVLAAGGANRPMSVDRFPRQAQTLSPQLCMGILPGACFLAPSPDAVPATLYGHFTQAIYRNRPIQ